MEELKDFLARADLARRPNKGNSPLLNQLAKTKAEREAAAQARADIDLFIGMLSRATTPQMLKRAVEYGRTLPLSDYKKAAASKIYFAALDRVKAQYPTWQGFTEATGVTEWGATCSSR